MEIYQNQTITTHNSPQGQEPLDNVTLTQRKWHIPTNFGEKIQTMSSLATAAAATRYTKEGLDKEVRNESNPHHESLQSKTLNQDMETDGSKDLGKHLDKFINEADTEADPQDKEISFGGGQTFF